MLAFAPVHRVAILLVVTAIAAIGAATTAPAAPTQTAAAGKRIWFRAADGTRLAGQRYGRGQSGVVFAHESRGGGYQWATEARRLAARGYLAITFDFRGYGRSQARGGRARARYAADVTAAAKRARALGSRRVILIGASMGGTAVVVGAANARPPVNAVVALSAPSTFVQMDGLAAARKLQMPVLYAVGSGDVDFAPESRLLYDATASAEKRLEIVDSGAHGVHLLGDPGLRELVERFIAAHASR